METNCAPFPGAASPDPVRYRKAISHFPTGIAIVASEDDEGGIHGMTVSSFTSISLEPPTVMVSLKAGKMHQLISRQGGYGVSILREDQQSYSVHFGGRPHTLLEPDFVVRERVPTVRDSLAWFECEIIERIQVQDHTLFIAQVVACGHHEGSPLIFFASRYHRQALEGC
ncbi:styrene monooxygenase NADH-dependent flavin reductase subunit StyB [Undibacterium arcticum]|uniref:Styrene monooxygenase NADH-dependent flavin reductase subunit StyB n=1 Tax=Undibacterium arcticum TaxID=1762892 RepID=A0ABV7EX08_9BURK